MAERGDIHVEWNRSPRHIVVEDPSTELVQQDLADTANGPLETSWDGMDEPKLISPAGKETLDATTNVGITNTLENALIAFEARTTSIESGTATTADATGTVLIDTTAFFETNLVESGDVIVNLTDGSVTTVISVDSEIQITHYALDDGVGNDWGIGDAYKVWPIAQCFLSGGNTVAVDDVGDPLTTPIAKTAFTQVIMTSSASATFAEDEAIQYSSYQNAVWVDVVNGSAGAAYPYGTREFPVNNIPDAVSIAATKGFDTLQLLTDVTFDTGDDVEDLTIIGRNPTQTDVTINTGALTARCEIRDCTISGTLYGGTTIVDCTIGTMNYINGEIHHSMLLATITLGGGATAHLHGCYSGVPGTATPTIDMGGSGQELGMRAYSGGIELTNKSGADNVSIDLVAGQVILDSSVTNGVIVCRGVGEMADNSVGATVYNALINLDNVEGTVWEAAIADHNIAGAYGHELATKADIGAAASTDQDTAVSGTVVEGTETSGTYASTAVRDGTYWQITEDGTNGIIAELVFNLPSADSRPGVFKVHGRYTGNPSNVHYQDLWAYNYEATSFEQLVEEFMPGGNTTDGDYQHEYYERHIDRTNNNEVKIRIVHNVTSYNGSHNLYLDYAEVSSISVITGAEIASAVLDADTGDHEVVGSFGEMIQTIEAGTSTIDWSMIQLIWDAAGGRRKLDTGTNQEIFYKADNTTEVMRFNLFDNLGAPTTTNVFERVRV